MNKYCNYNMADLTEQQIDKLKETEEILRRISHKDIILVAYIKD